MNENDSWKSKVPTFGGRGPPAGLMATRGGSGVMFGRSFVMFIALAVFPGWPTAALAAPQQFTDAFVPEDCGLMKLQVRGPEPACGFVSVPLRHGEGASPRIRLAVVVIPALDVGNRRPDPLFLAQGGPGGSTIGSFAQSLLDDPGKRPTLNRDLVLWDQRGTYFSQPRLRCREGIALPPDADEKAQHEAFRRCGERLAREAGDLSAFNSLENARDVDDVRAALGYQSFNFYGVSYGTELGQFLMRERPPGLRSVVLDAVVPLGFSLVTGVPAVRQQVMPRYAESCAASPACNAAYPDLANRYQALLERLDKNPVPVALGPAAQPVTARRVSPASGGEQKAPSATARPDTPTISGRDFDAALYQSVYQRDAVPFIPYIVQRAEQGDFSFMLNIVRMMQASNDDMADAMYMTVVCAEFGDTPESALKFPGVVKRLVEAGENDARQILQLCRDWKIRLLDKSLLLPVRSDIPTLLLSGRFDPITPPEGAERVAAHLSRAFSFTFPRGAHGQAFVVPCANFMIANFLEEPTRAPDGTCAREAAAAFVTPDQLITLPALKRGGSASLQDQMAALAGPAQAVVFALLLLFSAVPVYAVTEVVRIFRRRATPLPGDWRGRMILAAPWVPVLAAILLSVFLAAAVNSVGSVLQRNQFLLLLGAVPAWVKELSWGLIPFMLVMLLMTLTALLLWSHGARSKMGRLYYTAQVIAGWSVCVALVKTGLFGF